MSDTENTITPEPHDILAAFSLLTRLPVPVDHTRSGERAAVATWVYPIVGAAVGALSGLVVYSAMTLLLPSGFAAALGLLVAVALTGAMHEDGLADCADGFWGGHDRERRLEIMKDSSIGAYGAVVLVIFLLAEWSAIEALVFSNPILTFAGISAVSRLPMVLAMWVMPNARENGLAAGVGMPPALSVQIAMGITFAIALVTLGWAGIAAMICAVLAALIVGIIANAKIQGYTGDVLGAIQKCAALAALAAVLAI
jgi:adenosylcobinamide-GDP ribazoletransferase